MLVNNHHISGSGRAHEHDARRSECREWLAPVLHPCRKSRWSDALAIMHLQIFILHCDVTLPSRTNGQNIEATNLSKYGENGLTVEVACILPDTVTIEGIKNTTTPSMRRCYCACSRENFDVRTPLLANDCQVAIAHFCHASYLLLTCSLINSLSKEHW